MSLSPFLFDEIKIIFQPRLQPAGVDSISLKLFTFEQSLKQRRGGEPVWLTINNRFLARNDRLHIFYSE